MRTKDALEDLRAKMDVVFVDAPCSGSGTWRRNPDSKWRLRPNALARRLQEQREALALGAGLVKPGGVLIYVTCSVLPEENEDQVRAFVGDGFAPLSAAELKARGAEAGINAEIPLHDRGVGVQMTPLQTGCDGFFVAALKRAG
jgi:16S rRNA (cytosine967-C5)-methyltransferase